MGILKSVRKVGFASMLTTGISAGGLVTGWAAQQRQDIDQAVLISPCFGFAVVS